MSLPSIAPQTRTEQRQHLRHPSDWSSYIWLVALVVPATNYQAARAGQKIWVPGVYQKPYVPYLPVDSDDPRNSSRLWFFLECMADIASYPIEPALVPVVSLERMREADYIPFVFPDQLGLITRDTLCARCGMVTVADGFEMFYGAAHCDPSWCLQPASAPTKSRRRKAAPAAGCPSSNGELATTPRTTD